LVAVKDAGQVRWRYLKGDQLNRDAVVAEPGHVPARTTPIVGMHS